MKIVKFSKIVLGTLLAFGVSACSHNNAPVEDGGANAQASQTQGLDDASTFADETSANRLLAPFNQVYHFDFNKYDVRADDIASINAQANYLVAHTTGKVRLEGNADQRGSREYNIALGWKRAKAVNAILKKQGVGDNQIAMMSYGKEKPVALGTDEESYAKNRRTDLVYESK